MLKAAILMSILSLASVTAVRADCVQVDGTNPPMYRCDMPTPAPKCAVLWGSLWCNAPVDDDHAPSNCGWHKGKFRCVDP